MTESDLVTDLARPSRVADTSWIKPGAAAWSWWAEGQSPGNLARQKQYVDYATKHGWEYSLVDSGWQATWIPELAQYGAERDVGIWIWVRWQQVDAQSERDRLFALWKSWGVVGLKIDFPESDGQDRMRWYDAVLADTAKHQLMLNFHGCTIPRGTERTWPHVLTVDPGRRAVLARRHGTDWFIGATTAGPAGTTSAPLGFLPPGEWLAELYQDGPDGKLALTSRQVTRADTITVPTAANGGFTAHLCPARAGTCAT